MERLIGKYIFDPEMTAGKMIFLTGPRQVGKTTFAQKWLESVGSEDTYFKGQLIGLRFFISMVGNTHPIILNCAGVRGQETQRGSANNLYYVPGFPINAFNAGKSGLGQ